MTNNTTYTSPDDRDKEIRDFFSHARIPYTRQPEELWKKLESKLESQASQKGRVVSMQLLRLAAASILFLLGMALFMRLYTKTIEAPHGKHLATVLPDGSTVELNAGSTLQYHPYWWRFKREAKFFRGEGYFEVQKGKTFRILSGQGYTEVLGTSFNIYARNDVYQVTCFTGKVLVGSESTAEKVILHPNNKARLERGSRIQIDSVPPTSQITAWRQNKFVFTAAPIGDIFSEIERQYNITINFKGTDTLLHTASFAGTMKKELVLNMICKPNGLRFSTGDGKNYTISAID